MWWCNSKGLWPSKWRSWVHIHLPLSYMPPTFLGKISGVAFLGGGLGDYCSLGYFKPRLGDLT
jgi:hypothetical protein